jgi:hypothetical protein
MNYEITIGHDEFDLDRFSESTTSMVIFKITSSSSLGRVGEIGRAYLSDDGYINFSKNVTSGEMVELERHKVVGGKIYAAPM